MSLPSDSVGVLAERLCRSSISERQLNDNFSH